ncbi:MAG: ABC transporter substrate-binding protein [Chloroflexota bacterium]|nr:ABC transporter substrate-binding protein [Chloroflexota bacterium]
MNSRLKFTTFMLILFLGLEVVPSAFAQSHDYEAPHSQRGPASDKIQFQSFHVDLAGESLKAGDMDMYAFSLKTEAARNLKGTDGVTVYEAPATSISLLLNPAPAPEGELNPFSIKEVRQALQYAVDRQFIVQEIYKGLAEPMIAHVGAFDYDYLTVYDELKQETIAFAPDLARQDIADAMVGAGAELVNGKWHFNELPIQLKFLIRVEDERREIGDLIRSQMESLGFIITPNYQNFAPAILTVYGSDPQLFQWHMYTEGWGRGAAERFDFGTINSMAAPWLGNMPGWQESVFWQYENQQLDILGKQLFQGNFDSKVERNQIYNQMTGIALDESVRVWLATIVNNLPVSEAMLGITQDISSGPKSIWTLREAYIPGKETLTVGNLWVWTERTTWNPIGGFGDVYSNDIWQNVYDPPLWRDPFTGIPMPFRVLYDVTTAGPASNLEVPSDAFTWNPERDMFVSVGAGIQATSKVTYNYSKYFQSKWHHGQPITMADVIYSISQRFDLTYDADKSRIERAIAVTSKPFLETFKGFRIISDNEIEVFVDFWHFENDYIAEYASPSGLSMPWEILAAMDKLVFEDRRAAYSNTAAQRFNVPWINLVMDNDSRLVRRALIEMRDSAEYSPKMFQIGDNSLVTETDVNARIEATLDWIADHGMAIISNGPFKLVRYEPPAQFAEIEAYRDPTYPFKPGDWYRGDSPKLEFGVVEVGQVEIGSAAVVEVTVNGPTNVDVHFLLLDPVTGEMVAKGDGEPGASKTFRISLPVTVTENLLPGLYELFVVASSDQVSSLAERKINLNVVVDATQPQDMTLVQPSMTSTPTPDRTGFACSGPPLAVAVG